MFEQIPLLHIAISMAAVVLMIISLKMEPIIALILGAVYLGLATGQGGLDTVQTMATGFGGILTEIGLLIGFGVLLGSLLHALGAAQKLAGLLVRTFGPKRLPYAYGVLMGSVFPAIYSDVLVVITAPMTKLASKRMGKNGHGLLSGAAIVGMVIGVVFVIPGAAALALAGVAGVPLPTMLMYGAPIGIVTIVVTIACYSGLIKVGLWDEAKDQEEDEVLVGASAAQAGGRTERSAVTTKSAPPPPASSEPEPGPGIESPEKRTVSLLWSLLPLALTVGLIAANSLLQVIGIEAPAFVFLGDAHVALFLGLLSAYLIALYALPRATVSDAISTGLKHSGSILLLTGVSGCLAAVVGGTGAEDDLTALFDSGLMSPIVLTWLIAAVMHAAIGSVSVAAITAVSILAPVVPSLGIDPVLIALAAGAGALFAGLVNANAFWLFKSVLGLSVRGAFKAYTLPLSIASIVSLGAILTVGAVT